MNIYSLVTIDVSGHTKRDLVRAKSLEGAAKVARILLPYQREEHTKRVKKFYVERVDA